MKAGLFFTSNGPMLILTRYDSLKDPSLLDRFRAKGFNKFVAYEVPIESVRNRYGNHFQVVLEDLQQDDTLRVLDEEGSHVLDNISLKELSEPVIWEGSIKV